MGHPQSSTVPPCPLIAVKVVVLVTGVISLTLVRVSCRSDSVPAETFMNKSYRPMMPFTSETFLMPRIFEIHPFPGRECRLQKYRRSTVNIEKNAIKTIFSQKGLPAGRNP